MIDDEDKWSKKDLEADADARTRIQENLNQEHIKEMKGREARAEAYLKRYQRNRRVRWLLIILLALVIAAVLYTSADADGLLVIPSLDERYSVVQDNRFVTNQPNEVTEFRDGWFLAHLEKAGASWKQLEVGDVIVYDGVKYTIETIRVYRALDNTDPRAPMQDTYDGRVLSAKTILDTNLCDECVTLMTCVYNGENFAWGRLFITARGG